jgi:hypothetical protein
MTAVLVQAPILGVGADIAKKEVVERTILHHDHDNVSKFRSKRERISMHPVLTGDTRRGYVRL